MCIHVYEHPYLNKNPSTFFLDDEYIKENRNKKKRQMHETVAAR